jgi:hypothetical protein
LADQSSGISIFTRTFDHGRFEKKLDGIVGFHPSHIDVGIWGVSAAVWVASRDQDVAMDTAGEKLLEVDFWVVGVVNQQQPFGPLLR